MKQVLSQLAASQRRRARAAPDAGRTGASPARGRLRSRPNGDASEAASGQASPVAPDRHSLCLRATLLFARWQRCGQGRIGMAMGCLCAGEAAIDLAELDGMILDHLHQRFAKRDRLRGLIEPALQQADAGQRALAGLLQTLAQPQHGLRPRECQELLEALHTSIASIEEHRGIA